MAGAEKGIKAAIVNALSRNSEMKDELFRFALDWKAILGEL